jgi:hypothetical protein
VDAKTEWYLSSGLALVGGAIVMIYTLFFAQQISYSYGFSVGSASVISEYNVTPSNSLVALFASTPTLQLALYIVYIMGPFALIMFSSGALWLFTRAYARLMAALVMVSAVVFSALTALLEFNFTFHNSITAFLFPYLGSILAFVAGAYTMLLMFKKSTPAKRAVRQIAIDPKTPYSNIMNISNRLMGKLNGNVKIIDMHFDSKGIDNLARLVKGAEAHYAEICVLTRADRLTKEFERNYNDFRNELQNRGITFELRVMNDDDAKDQHERLLMDDSSAYKIPPLNIINKKSENIVSINHDSAARRFDELWSRATKPENIR